MDLVLYSLEEDHEGVGGDTDGHDETGDAGQVRVNPIWLPSITSIA